MSIDLKKANFQALRYYNPDLVQNAKTYQEFIGLYDSSPLLAESKYTRQMSLFMNSQRTISLLEN